ncbi:PAS domain S-box protein [Phenylobacterium sp.]|uniref:PAS domain S-box protein n=1 Tax=Phenylobacterium sp. TaxID=1871053 RepID=UPI00289EFBBD|nr:PAS domain S-box protein [Phenylobacterium sp.]
MSELNRVTLSERVGEAGAIVTGGADKTAVLYQFTDRLFRARSADDVYDAALGAICEAVNCERASILLFDDAGEMRFAAWRGLSAEYREAVAGHTPWRQGETDARPIMVEDVAQTDDPLKHTILAEDVRSLAFIPLTASGGVIGKFMIYYAKPRRFSDQDIELALTIGRQVSFSLERLRSETALRLERELLQSIIDRIPVMITVYEPRRALLRVNRAFEEVLGWSSEPADTALMERLLPDPEVREKVRAFMEACPEDWLDVSMATRAGGRVETSWANVRLSDATQVGIGLDITTRKRGEAALRRYATRMELLNRIMRTLSSDLELNHILQEATDSATRLTGARFGAFFYNPRDGGEDGYQLQALSGGSREAFGNMGSPHVTDLFGPTFRGEEVVRVDDVTLDPRYGQRAPHFGMPAGHPPLLSYLAAPVVSRSGEVHGGLFFGHEQPGAFSQEDEDLVSAIAAQTAIALDHAGLLAAKQREIEQRRQAEFAAQRLAAIVESSEDAILGKDLNGIITSWNDAAERMLGYSADDVIGKSMMMMVPTDRLEEEGRILAKIRAGERIPPLETTRLCKNGQELPVSLSVSPVRNADGMIVGASTIARDITERREAEARRELLLREMDHRIKNLFTLAGGLVTLSARQAADPAQLASMVRERLASLARAHSLTLEGRGAVGATSLHALIATILSPYDDTGARVAIEGPDVTLNGGAVTALALLLHELATNAAKYGALSSETGHIKVSCAQAGERFTLIWIERGGPGGTAQVAEGFGFKLIGATVKGQLAGEISREWRQEGLVVSISVSSERLTGGERPEAGQDRGN